MSQLVSRILLSIFMFPVAGLFYLCVAMFTSQAIRGPGMETAMFLFSGALTWGAVMLYWILLWRSSIQWDSRRTNGTWLAGAAALGVGLLAGMLATGLMRAGPNASFGIFIGSVATMIAWLISTVFIWRETPAERAGRVKAASKSAITCPTCGYNLTGLTETRCPECGSKFTIDELIAMQPETGTDVE